MNNNWLHSFMLGAYGSQSCNYSDKCIKVIMECRVHFGLCYPKCQPMLECPHYFWASSDCAFQQWSHVEQSTSSRNEQESEGQKKPPCVAFCNWNASVSLHDSVEKSLFGSDPLWFSHFSMLFLTSGMRSSTYKQF